MRIPILALVVLVGLAQTAAPPPELGAEIARVRQEIAAAVPAEQRTGLNARLDRAGAALSAQRSYLALYLLENAYEGSAAFSFARASGVTTQDVFLKTWTDAGVPVLRGTAAGSRPAVVDALAAAAEGRAVATYQASRPYAQDAGVDAGLYYLGESRAVTAFAAFARTLRWADAGRRPPFRSIAPEIAALDAEMTRRYETMEAENHATYIVASAALKQARSLNDSGHHDGALMQYLLSLYLFAPLRGPAQHDATPERIAAARGTLGAGGDHSIAELFLQLAEEAVPGTVRARRRGAAVIDVAPPASVAAVAPPLPTAPAPPAAAVTITLVR